MLSLYDAPYYFGEHVIDPDIILLAVPVFKAAVADTPEPVGERLCKLSVAADFTLKASVVAVFIPILWVELIDAIE